jgi:hypothetical protein
MVYTTGVTVPQQCIGSIPILELPFYLYSNTLSSSWHHSMILCSGRLIPSSLGIARRDHLRGIALKELCHLLPRIIYDYYRGGEKACRDRLLSPAMREKPTCRGLRASPAQRLGPADHGCKNTQVPEGVTRWSLLVRARAERARRAARRMLKYT